MQGTKLKFFEKFIKDPVSVGSVIPSSKFLCKSVKKIVYKLEDTRIMEIGAGTGTLTAGIKHKKPILVEIDPDLSKILAKKFPELTILNSCALEEIDRIDEETGIVFSIPLVNNPMKKKFVDAINKKYLEGKIKWFVIYTYQPKNPLKGIKFRSQEKKDICLLNFPPAHVWVYK